MKESAHSFGTGGFGILTEPAGRTDRPTVLLLNAGTVYRVGPHRTAVDLARRLAAVGFPAFRLDLSGIGDSAFASESRDLGEQAVVDVRAAMEALASKRGATRFILGGTCLGAVHAHRVAVADPRVVGVVTIDGYAYPTWRFWMHRYGPKLADPKAVGRALGRALGRAKARVLGRMGRERGAPVAASREPDPDADLLDQDFPPRHEAARDLAALVARKVELLFIYTANWYLYFNYPGQVSDAFPEVPFGSCLDVEYFRDADHTFTLLDDREKLFARILDWAEKRFG